MTDLSAPMPPGSSPGSSPGTSPGQHAAPPKSQQAAEAADAAKSAAGDVTQTAAANAKDVAGEAKRQARDLVGEARDQLNGQVDVQHRNLVSNLHTLADELGRMSDASEQQTLAGELVGQAGERARGAADWIGNRRPGDFVDEVRSFARQRPGTFLLGALVAGVAVGRLTRGVVAAHTDDDSSSPAPNGYAGGYSPAGAGSGVPEHQGLPTAEHRSVYGNADPDEITSGMPTPAVTPAGTYPRPPEPPGGLAGGPGTVPA